MADAVLLVSALLLVGCTADPGTVEEKPHVWRLVYQNSMDGRPFSGSVDTLIGALKRGSPIRVSWGGEEGAGTGETWIEFAEPDFTTVIDDSAVVVQFPLSFIQTSYSDVGRTYLDTDPPTGWRGLMSTDGTYHQFHYELGTGEVTQIMYARTQVSWFALLPARDEAPAHDLTPSDAFRLDSVVRP